MKRRKIFYIVMAVAAGMSLTACLGDNDDPYQAGFLFTRPTSQVTGYFANETSDSIVFTSYGSWTMSDLEGYDNSWLTVTTRQGKGYSYNSIPVTLQQNTTGKGRWAGLRIVDNEHSDKAQAAIAFYQYATRGDGSLGMARDVASITGTDGSLFEFGYDENHRPTSLRITRDDILKRSLRLSYRDADSTLTIQDNDKTIAGKFGRDFQPGSLIGNGDTVTYAVQRYSNGMAVSANYAFNLRHSSLGGKRTIYAFLLGGQSLAPDSLHHADSVRVAYIASEKAEQSIEGYALRYSTTDNRHQSVDANQLLFGPELCDPYQLLSLFRYCRSTSIVSEVRSDKVTLAVQTEVNADGSIKTLTVTPSNGTAITYTFNY